MERGVENINVCCDHSHQKTPNLERSSVFPEFQRTPDDPLGINGRAYLLMNEERDSGDALEPVCLWLLQLQTLSERHGYPSKSCCVTQAQQPEFKVLDTNTLMLQVEGQRGGFTVSPWGAWVSTERGAFIRKNVDKMAAQWPLNGHSVHRGSPLRGSLLNGSDP